MLNSSEKALSLSPVGHRTKTLFLTEKSPIADFNPIDRLTFEFKRWRYSVVSRFEAVTRQTQYSGWHLALTTGERVALTQDEKTLLKESGTAHLIAISGLHVGLVFVWSYLVFSGLWRLSVTLCLWISAEKVALVLGFCVATLFSLMAGFDTPTQRALIALGLYVVSRFCLVKWSPFYLLSLTLILLLLINPISVLSEGFWLTLFALLIIFWSLPIITGTYPLWGWFKLQFALSLGMSLLSALLFGKLSSNAILSNVLAIPLVSFVILPLDLIAFLLHQWAEPVAAVLLTLSDQMVHWLVEWLLFLNHIFPSIALDYQVIALLSIFFVLIYTIHYLRHSLLTILCATNMLLLGVFGFSWPNSSLLDIYFMDVGQGTSVIIQSGDHWMVYDTGYADQTFSAVESHILPFLYRQGVSNLDLLVISHSDLDHSGDWQTLAAALNAKQVILGETLGDSLANCRFQKQHFGYATVTWFQSKKAQTSGGNNASCIIRIDVADRSVLLTGDIETQAELDLVATPATSLKADVLLVPHHGSRSSSSWSFLMQVEPQLAVVTNGYLNRFGHPHHDIVQRYRLAKIPLIQTSEAGMIHLSLNPHYQWQLEQYRTYNARFWNHAPLRRNFNESVVN
jgi:competence protein ComEC